MKNTTAPNHQQFNSHLFNFNAVKFCIILTLQCTLRVHPAAICHAEGDDENFHFGIST